MGKIWALETQSHTKITKLQQSLKVKDTEIDKLREAVRNEKIEVSNAKGQLQDVRKENSSLQQKLGSNTARLSELEGFATTLHDNNEEIW